MSIDRILDAAARQPWAIMPEKVAEIRAFLELRASGVRFTPAEIEARVGSGRAAESVPQNGAVAVISLFGIVSQRANMMSSISGPGGTSTDQVSEAFRRAVADPGVKAIILNVDSPGGGVYGVQELANEIHRAKGKKPVVAQVNSLAASAAYWIASAASEVVITPGGEVGSIGVYALHQDVSGMMDKAGVKNTYVSAGEFKVEGNPYEPLSPDAAATLQKRVNEIYGDFVASVARGRNTTAARVKSDFGKGRVVGAREAIKLGMADRVDTLQGTLRRFGVGATASSGSDNMATDMRARLHQQRLRAAGPALSPTDDMRMRRHRQRLRTNAPRPL